MGWGGVLGHPEIQAVTWPPLWSLCLGPLGAFSIASLPQLRQSLPQAERRPSHFTDTQGQCKLLGFRKKWRGTNLQEKMQNWDFVPIYLQSCDPGELQKAVESEKTFVWHPGLWALWSLGAVDDEFSVQASHLSSNSICENQGQPPSLQGFTKATLGLSSTEWNLHWAKPSLTHNLMFFILQLDIQTHKSRCKAKGKH